MSTTFENKVQPDVVDVLKKLRERLAIQAQTELARSTSVHGQVSELDSDPVPELRQLLSAMQSANGRIGTLNPRHPGILNSSIQRMKRLLQRLLTWYTRPITEAHVHNERFLAEATRLLESHESRVRSLEQQIRVQRAELVELRAVLHLKLEGIITELEKRTR
jgi:hypothetical protein